VWDEDLGGVAERGKQRVTPLVSAKKLGKKFGRTVGLATLDLELAKGMSLAVLGPNGAGKSTLLRLMAGLARPTSGSLEIDGVPAHQKAARAMVGFIGHASHLYPDLTARENLIFAAKLHGVSDPAKRATQLLAEEGLERAADRPTRGFSRGMAQRLAIARGLIQEPSIVLLDEPFTGLDGRSAERLERRIMKLRAKHCTLVMVSHDVALAARIADAAIVMAGGVVRHTHGATDAQSSGDLDPEALGSAYDDASDAGRQ
jgi:heme exporter protein A